MSLLDKMRVKRSSHFVSFIIGLWDLWGQGPSLFHSLGVCRASYCAWHILGTQQIITEWINNRIIWNQPTGKLLASIYYIQEHIIGSLEETEKTGKRKYVNFWNIQSRCSKQVYDFWLKTIKSNYLKKKVFSLGTILARW